MKGNEGMERKEIVYAIHETEVVMPDNQMGKSFESKI